MELQALTAISPVDGRYRRVTSKLSPYYSEFGLMKYRVQVEIEYVIFLADLAPGGKVTPFSTAEKTSLRNIYHHFSTEDAEQIKTLEKTTNHDVKAVEYFLKKKLEDLGLFQYTEWIHFGLTSQDINNTAIPLSLKEGIYETWQKPLQELLNIMRSQADQWKDIPMLARTHGQPASPTRLGKEWNVFIQRVENQLHGMKALQYPAKFGGATGNFNAHYAAFPEIDWHEQGRFFVEKIIGLQRSFPTTQIDHYDGLSALFDQLKRINTIFIDFCQDVWLYISMEYFKQQIKEGEVGSSAMPHKVNPIDFENAEGNLGLANAILEFLSRKLPVSRLQRDLTDSTVLRNIGVPAAHILIAIESIKKGLQKLMLNEQAVHDDLEKNFIVISEAIQTVLRREGFPKPYEALKDLTRTHQKPSFEDLQSFIKNLEVSESVKSELLSITPSSYLGK